MTVDASYGTGYRGCANNNDMSRNLILPSYLVNRSLPGADRFGCENTPNIRQTCRPGSSRPSCVVGQQGWTRYNRRAGTRVRIGRNSVIQRNPLFPPG